MPARFIVLDGPDGSGTTYHSRLLTDRLIKERHAVLLTAEPTDGRIGKQIREHLKRNDLSFEELQKLFVEDRRDHVDSVIQPALDRGETVICDRYLLSTVAYGAATGGKAEELLRLNAGFPKPDCTILLLPPLGVCLERLSRRPSQDMFETRALQEKVHAAYRELADSDPTIRVIDSSGSKEEVAEKILTVVNGFIR